MTEAQHTPYYVTSSGGTISDVKTETVICTLATEPLSITHEVEDTAEFIVKACNSFDPLVEALEGLLNDLDGKQYINSWDNKVYARKALEQAKE